jgi:hypothetical protein
MANSSFIKLNRESTKITISEFYERFQLKKYNFDPEYQRRGDVWTDEKQSFLIDSILKNYPMPPIFLHQVIDSESGATKYNVIDGKQRLSAILKFINNELSLPSDYDVGAFGDSRLNEKKFGDLDGELQEFKMQFWRYILSVEYIETGDIDVINNVFDRLNRNGEPLEPQELRKAKYYNTELIRLVEELVQVVDWNNLGKIKINRMQDAEFVSELIFFLLEKAPLDASKKENIDEYYAKWADGLTTEKAGQIKETFIQTVEYLKALTIDFEKYKINGVSHFYALFAFANHCAVDQIEAATISSKLNEFYECLRNSEDLSGDVKAYRESMQANTRSKGQRTKRINALIQYCGV